MYLSLQLAEEVHGGVETAGQIRHQLLVVLADLVDAGVGEVENAFLVDALASRPSRHRILPNQILGVPGETNLLCELPLLTSN